MGKAIKIVCSVQGLLSPDRASVKWSFK